LYLPDMLKDRENTAIYTAYDDIPEQDNARAEKELLRAILENAMSDLEKPGELGRRARQFFLSADSDYIFSFQSICDFLEVDPKRILIVSGLKDKL